MSNPTNPDQDIFTSSIILMGDIISVSLATFKYVNPHFITCSTHCYKFVCSLSFYKQISCKLKLKIKLSFYTLASAYDTRRNIYKHEFRKHYLANRVTPNNVVVADSINSFKSRQDKFWSLHDFVYDYRAQALTSGSTRYRFHATEVIWGYVIRMVFSNSWKKGLQACF